MSLALLGFRPDPLTGRIRPPHATTIRLVLAAVDGGALDRALGDFLQGRKAPAPGRKVIAVDGKTLRGSRATRRELSARQDSLAGQSDLVDLLSCWEPCGPVPRSPGAALDRGGPPVHPRVLLTMNSRRHALRLHSCTE